MPQIPILLQPEPEVRAHAGHLGEAQRRVGRDAALRVDHFIQPRKRHAELQGEGGLRQAERLEEFLEQHLARMGWRPMRGQATLHQRRRLSGSP